jgi:hypothetical protein
MDSAEQRVVRRRDEHRQCAADLERTLAWEVDSAAAAAYDRLASCAGAYDAALLAIRRPDAPARLHLARNARGPEAVELALRAARAGRRSAFQLLAFQLGRGAARVPDDLPASWLDRDHLPGRGCGPIHIVTPVPLGGDTLPLFTGIASVIAMADSIAADPGRPPAIRVSAYCLARQLR